MKYTVDIEVDFTAGSIEEATEQAKSIAEQIENLSQFDVQGAFVYNIEDVTKKVPE